VAAKSGQFTADETGKGQFLCRNRKNLAEERVLRKISYRSRIAGIPYLCNGRASKLETWAKGRSVAPVLLTFPEDPVIPNRLQFLFRFCLKKVKVTTNLYNFSGIKVLQRFNKV